MKTLIWSAAICLAGTAFGELAAAGSSDKAQASGRKPSAACVQKDAASVIALWPAVTQAAARALIEKYGPPSGVMENALSWASDDQKVMRVWLYGHPVLDDDPVPHRDFIENTIDYSVPKDKVAALLRFDHALDIDQLRRKLRANSDSEKNNILALNLANEIVTGVRDVSSARALWKKTILESMAGKSSPYTERLMFTPEER